MTNPRVLAACRAHWPSWDRMRPDHARKWYAKMEAAILAADRVPVSERAALGKAAAPQETK